jgi:tyrosyl-tRNA synthetase
MEITSGRQPLAELLVSIGMAASKGQAKRLIEQGRVGVNSEKATNAKPELSFNPNEKTLIQVGKFRFVRLIHR